MTGVGTGCCGREQHRAKRAPCALHRLLRRAAAPLRTTTTMSGTLSLAFDAALIPASVHSSVPAGLEVRAQRRCDAGMAPAQLRLGGAKGTGSETTHCCAAPQHFRPLQAACGCRSSLLLLC